MHGLITKLAMYSFICIVGVIGNLFLLLAISRVKLIRKITKKLVVNLIVIDLLINGTFLPDSIMKLIHPDLKDNPYSVAFIRCKVLPYISNLLCAALINTLMALTIDRYIAIVHPFRSITKRDYRISMTLIWSLAAIFRTPEMLLTHLNNNDMKCERIWPSNSIKYVYYFFDGTENCILPTCIVVYCYVAIWRVVKNHRIPGERTDGNERVMETMEANRMKSIDMIFYITMYFVISALPWYIAFLTYELAKHERNRMREHTIPFWLDCLALTHLFMNPLLCCLTNSFIRKSMKNSIKCCFGASAERHQHSAATSTII